MLKISKVLGIVALSLASFAANATTYNFNFPAYDGSGTSTSGSFSGTFGASWAAATTYSGSISTTNPYGLSGSISNLYARNTAPNEWALSFNVGSAYYTFNMTSDIQKRNTSFAATDSYYFSGKNGVQSFSAALSPSSSVTAASVPEIDGNKLPQVLLLGGALAFFFRARSRSNINPMSA